MGKPRPHVVADPPYFPFRSECTKARRSGLGWGVGVCAPPLCEAVQEMVTGWIPSFRGVIPSVPVYGLSFPCVLPENGSPGLRPSCYGMSIRCI